MKKIILTILSIIFFQTQVFSFPAQPTSVLLPNNNSAINNSVSLSCLLPADSSSVIPAKSLGGNLSEINTTQSLSKLNRDISTTQELMKNQTTRALNINTTIDLRLLSKEGRKDILTALKNAPKNTKQATKNLIKDIKTTVSKTEEIIKQTITKQTKDELTKNVDKIKFSKNKQENKKVKDKILRNEELAKLQIAIDNIKVLEEYLKNNNLDSQTIEKLKELGATGEYSYVIGNNGELLVYGYEYESKVIDDNNIQMTLSTIEALDEKFLKQESKGTYKEILSNTISDATTSIQIAVGSSKELYKIGKDTNEVIEDTKELIKEIAKSSQDKKTYEIAKETIKKIPNSIKETYYATVNVSNIENLQALGYNIGSKIYEYKENPISLLEDTASILTSYDLYKTGLTEENIIYATGLIVGGLAIDVAGTPLKAGKTITTTAKEIKVAEKLVDTTKATSTVGKVETIADTSKYLGKEIGETKLVTGEQWARKLRAEYGDKNVEWVNATPSQLARSWQGTYPYFGVDNYVDVTITKGTVLFRGDPNGTEFFTTRNAIEQSERNATKLFEGLQVRESKKYGYKSQMVGYVFKENTIGAYGRAVSNTDFGKGGLEQYFIPNIEKYIEKGIVSPIEEIKLKK